MILYEVNLQVDGAIASDYLAWLRGHMAELLGLPGFMDATLNEVLDPSAEAGTRAFCVQYRLVDLGHLQGYFDHHAASFRAAGQARFGGRFRASRRVLQPIQP